MLFSDAEDSFMKEKKYLEPLPNSSASTERKLRLSRANSSVPDISMVQSSARSTSTKKFVSKIPGKNLLPIT